MSRHLHPDMDCATIEDDFKRYVALSARAEYRMMRGQEGGSELAMEDVEYELVNGILLLYY